MSDLSQYEVRSIADFDFITTTWLHHRDCSAKPTPDKPYPADLSDLQDDGTVADLIASIQEHEREMHP